MVVGGTGVSCGTGVGNTGVSCGTGVTGRGVFCGTGVEMDVGRTGVSVGLGGLVGVFPSGGKVNVGVIDATSTNRVTVGDAVDVKLGAGVDRVGVGIVGVGVKVGVMIMIRCAVGMILIHGAVMVGEGVWIRKGITRYREILVSPCATVTPKSEPVRATTIPKKMATTKTKITSERER